MPLRSLGVLLFRLEDSTRHSLRSPNDLTALPLGLFFALEILLIWKSFAILRCWECEIVGLLCLATSSFSLLKILFGIKHFAF